MGCAQAQTQAVRKTAESYSSSSTCPRHTAESLPIFTITSTSRFPRIVRDARTADRTSVRIICLAQLAKPAG